MTDLLRDVQVPFLAVLLLVAGATKAMSPAGRPGPVAAAPGGRLSMVTVAGAEVLLGMLLLTTSLGVVRLATVVFFATATSVVADLARRGSGDGCGCFGALSRSPAGRPAVIRAAALTLAAIIAAGVPRTGVQVLGRTGGGAVLALAAECALFVVLSPELAGVVSRIRHPVQCELRDVPLSATYATLRASRAWRAHVALLTSREPTEVWRELCLRYVVYPAEVDGRPAEVVFAVPVDGRRAAVRAGVTEDTSWDTQDDDSGPQRVHTHV